MADLSQLSTVAADLAVRARVKPCLMRLALDVQGEPVYAEGADLGDRTRQQKRRAYAQRVLADPGGEAELAQWAAVCWRQATAITAAYFTGGAAGITDSDLEWVLTSVWDGLANA